jgi:hypothetical protein
MFLLRLSLLLPHNLKKNTGHLLYHLASFTPRGHLTPFKHNNLMFPNNHRHLQVVLNKFRNPVVDRSLSSALIGDVSNPFHDKSN